MRNSILFFSLITSILGIACEQIGYKTTPSGLQYRFLEQHSEGLRPQPGQILKLSFVRNIGSPITDTPAQIDYTAYDSEQAKSVKARYNLTEIFDYLHEGDSVQVLIPLDSMLGRVRERRSVPDYQPGKTVNFYIKLLKILPNDSAYKQDVLQDKQRILALEPGRMANYARRHQLYGNLKNGVLVSVGKSGQGSLVELGDTLELRYSGFLVDVGNGEAFDSNFPISGQLEAPRLAFVVGSMEIIDGFNRAVLHQRIGDSLNVLIPSELAYGSTGAGHVIPPNSPLHFCLRLEKLRKARKG